jgi:hypothetical protein
MLGEEGMRAGRKAVGAGLEDGDEIARFGARRHDVVGETVERRAQAADDADLLLRLGAEAAGDRHRIVATDDLAEIARSGELVMHAAVGDEEGLAVALLAIEDPGEIDAPPPRPASGRARSRRRCRRGSPPGPGSAPVSASPTAATSSTGSRVEIGDAEAARRD